MSKITKHWDGEIVRKWLESRFDWSQVDQDWAAKHGRDRDDDYDMAVAEEWVCRQTKSREETNSQEQFVALLKELLSQDEVHMTGVHNDKRFEREVRRHLKNLVKMATANEGFENLSRFQ